MIWPSQFWTWKSTYDFDLFIKLKKHAYDLAYDFDPVNFGLENPSMILTKSIFIKIKQAYDLTYDCDLVNYNKKNMHTICPAIVT